MKNFKLLTLFFLFLNALFAEEEAAQDPFAPSSLTRTQSLLPTTVEDISVISGEWFLSRADFILPGPEPLIFHRSYSSNQVHSHRMGFNWNLNYPAYLKFTNSLEEMMKDKKYEACLTHTSGIRTLHRALHHPDKNTHTYELSSLQGLTNCLSEVSARTNLHNITFHHDTKKADCYVVTGSGSISYFVSPEPEDDELYPDRHLHLKPVYEKKPSGNLLIFKGASIHALNPKGTNQYSWIKLEADDQGIICRASNGSSVTYKFSCYNHGRKKREPRPGEEVEPRGGPEDPHYKVRKKRYTLSEVVSTDKPLEQYEYLHAPPNDEPTCSPPSVYLRKIKRPEGRFCQVMYYQKGDNWVGGVGSVHVSQEDKRYRRIKYRLAPAGVDEKPVITHRFAYHLNEDESGKTEVFDAYLRKTEYIYNKEHRLTEKRSFLQGELYATEHFVWDDHYAYSNEFPSIIGVKAQAALHTKFLPKVKKPKPKSLPISKGHAPPSPEFQEKVDEAQEKAEERAEEKKEEEERQEEEKTEEEKKPVIPLTRGHTPPPKHAKEVIEEHTEPLVIPSAPDFVETVQMVLKTHWQQEGGKGNLIGKYTKDASGNIETAVFFDYDKKGNIECEKLYGNLSGAYLNPSIIVGLHEIPLETHCECYHKYFLYSGDPFNLLIGEKEDNGKGMIYAYNIPYSDRLSAKYMTYHEHVIFRQFFEYDENTSLVKQIKDDGLSLNPHDLNNVKERHITYTTARKTFPVGLPEWVEEKYVDFATGQEVLLKKTHYTYSKEGRLICQDHFDSEGTYCYSLTWDYDSHGNVIKETNALGQEITRQYDANDNLIYEMGPSSDVYTLYTYDFSNRLIKSEEVHADGSHFSTSYRYDLNSNRTASIDQMGRETLYVYDDLNRLVQTIYPPVLNEGEETIQPVASISYDIFNRPVVATDARGNQTKTSYNARGKPIFIEHADGSLESYQYNLDGSLLKKTAVNGTATVYTRDILGRVLKEEILDANGTLLSSQTFNYDGFHLLSWIDGEGIETKYTYDGAGRVIQEAKGQACKSYSYDTLGRLSQINDQVSIKAFSYDLLDRLIEEKILNSQGHVLKAISYSYDLLGNRQETIEETSQGRSITRTDYNSEGKPIRLIDAEGHITHISYDYAFINDLDQRVLKVTLTDPQGNIKESIFDALNRLSTTIQKDSFGCVLAREHLFYDPCSHLAKTVNEVLIDGVFSHLYTVEQTYNARGEITSLIENAGLKDQKITYFTYNAYGQKEKFIKPDGTALLYTYDPLGRLKDFSASDGSFSYRYHYDNNHQVLAVEDLRFGLNTVRSYTPEGYLSSETLGNDLTLNYAYDPSGQVERVTLPDKSSIRYAYDGIFLRGVTKEKEGAVQYSHICGPYDLSGCLMEAQLIGQAGKISYSYDLLKRQRKLNSSFWKEEIKEYDQAGRLILKQVEDVKGAVDCAFSYDPLNHLIKETGFTSHTYKADSIHNRISKDGHFYSINRFNQVLASKDCAYTYDANGNLKTKTQGNVKTSYSYDALGRLVQVTQGKQIIEYFYDAFNRRLFKMKEGRLLRFIYQGESEVGLVNEEGEIEELRILGASMGSSELGASIALELKGRLFAPLHDHLGHVACLIDATTGKPSETYRYTAFGEEAIFDESGQEIATSKACNPWRFASKRFDEETGFIYFGQRYYDRELGRWITQDPIGFEDGPNLYAYLHHSPLKAFDAFGLVGEAYEQGCGAGRLAAHYDYDIFASDREPANGEPCVYSDRFRNTIREDELIGHYIWGAGTSFIKGTFRAPWESYINCHSAAKHFGYCVCTGKIDEYWDAYALERADDRVNFVFERVGEAAALASLVKIVYSGAKWCVVKGGSFVIAKTMPSAAARIEAMWAGRTAIAAEKAISVNINVVDEIASSKNVIDLLIRETQQGIGHFTSQYRPTALQALEAADKFLGKGYKELGRPGGGVFRSADGLRQFRMDSNSLLGRHKPWEPHVHLEIYKPQNLKESYINNHILLGE